MMMMSKQKEKFIRTKPHCNIGTIGHVDHGKTTLTAAITRVLALSGDTTTKYTAYADIDKHVEERSRGITITASHVEYETEARHYTHIDCPGHQNYIKNMITGATQMEGVILVVAVTEGPQEQTREHVILSREVAVPYILVFINKMDALKEPELAMFVELEVKDLLVTYNFPEETPFVFGSARTALEETEPTEYGITAVRSLMDQVDTYVPTPERPINEPFLMPISEVYSIQGRGTVVTGKVEKGRILVGDEVEVVGAKLLKTVCTGLEMYRKVLEEAVAGENVGVLVRGMKKDEVKRGNVLAKPSTITAVSTFEARAYFLTQEEGGRSKPIFESFMPQFFFRTANMTGALKFNEDLQVIMPGDAVTFKVKLLEKAALSTGLHFALREGTITLGRGVIVNIIPEEEF